MGVPDWSALAVALTALAGTIYSARQTRAAAARTARLGDRTADREAFTAITDALRADMQRLQLDRHEQDTHVRELRAQLAAHERTIRLAAAYIRDLISALRRGDRIPPPMPAGLALDEPLIEGDDECPR